MRKWTELSARSRGLVQARANRLNGADDKRVRSISCAESARAIHDKADQQNQTKSATADDGTAKIKAAAAEQKQKHQDDD